MNTAGTLDLETRLKELKGTKLNVEISMLEPDLMGEEMSLNSDGNSCLQLILDGILSDASGYAIVGTSKIHYWAIGTHTPHGYISRVIDADGNVVYENNQPYDFSRPS